MRLGYFDSTGILITVWHFIILVSDDPFYIAACSTILPIIMPGLKTIFQTIQKVGPIVNLGYASYMGTFLRSSG